VTADIVKLKTSDFAMQPLPMIPMNQCPSTFQSFDSRTVLVIPVEFKSDLPFSLPIKIEAPKPMKKSLLVPEKPLVPNLIENTTCVRDLKPAPANQTVLGEMMLDARRLEVVLKDFVRRKKAGMRRVAAGRFNKLCA
jgi:hypothetical protein